VALATGPSSTLMAIPGLQTGHVQLVHLTPCPSPPVDHTPGAQPARQAAQSPTPVRRHPVSHIIAHDSALSTISVSLSGRLIATTSEKGTLIRVWDAQSGEARHEFRRGIGQANIYGVAFRPDERECCVWSDKGTIHVFSLDGASYVVFAHRFRKFSLISFI
jgi:WD40 repeat protein